MKSNVFDVAGVNLGMLDVGMTLNGPTEQFSKIPYRPFSVL